MLLMKFSTRAEWARDTYPAMISQQEKISDVRIKISTIEHWPIMLTIMISISQPPYFHVNDPMIIITFTLSSYFINYQKIFLFSLLFKPKLY